MDILVSCDWLNDELGASDLVILDASAHLPSAERNPETEFADQHIPGARFLDLPSLKDIESPVPSALPTASQFEERLRLLGIDPDSRVVLYDDSMLRSAARAFFIFRMFGFTQIAILDGGLEKWRALGLPLSDQHKATATSDFSVEIAPPDRVRSKQDMLTNCDSAAEQVIDARDPGRFTGDVTDTVHGLEGGHIPGARNVHFRRLLAEDGTFLTPSELREAFEAEGTDLTKPITTSCGSGMTASVLLFALELLGHRDGALYDGSWSEWGADPSTPKETGPAQTKVAR